MEAGWKISEKTDPLAAQIVYSSNLDRQLGSHRSDESLAAIRLHHLTNPTVSNLAGWTSINVLDRHNYEHAHHERCALHVFIFTKPLRTGVADHS